MRLRDRGKGVYTRVQQSRFQVHTPYSELWVVTAHNLGGKWRKRASFWTFPRRMYPRVAAELNRIFGTALPVRAADDSPTSQN